MSKHDNLQTKPKVIPFLCIAVQIYLTYIFCNGFYTIFGERVKLFGVFTILAKSFDNAFNSPQDVFNAYAKVVLCIIYIVNVVRMIKIAIASIKSSKLLKQALKSTVVDAASVRMLYGNVIGGAKRILYISLAFLCYSALVSFYAFEARIFFTLVLVLITYMILEAGYLSYIQGKRFWFSFTKSLCGYLFVVMAVLYIFSLNGKTVFDFIYEVYSNGIGVTPNTYIDLLCYICLDCLACILPLVYALGLIGLFKLMFKKPQSTANIIAITKKTNLYLTSALIFITIICVCLRIRSGSVALNYWSVISSYLSIIIGAILAKVLISVANRRVKYVKSIDLPIAQNRTLD